MAFRLNAHYSNCSCGSFRIRIICDYIPCCLTPSISRAGEKSELVGRRGKWRAILSTGCDPSRLDPLSAAARAAICAACTWASSPARATLGEVRL